MTQYFVNNRSRRTSQRNFGINHFSALSPIQEQIIQIGFNQNLFTSAETSVYVPFNHINPVVQYKAILKILSYASGDPVTTVFYFEGPPGTGKTHFALNEFKLIIRELKEAIELLKNDSRAFEKLSKILQILRHDDINQIKSQLSTLMADELISKISKLSIFRIIKEIADADIQDVNIQYYKTLANFLSSALMTHFMVISDNSEHFLRSLDHYSKFFRDLNNSRDDDVETHLIVLPSLASSSEFLDRTIYVFNSGIREEQRISFLDILSSVICERKFVVLVLDELSELPHRQGEEEKSPKNLNEFLDGINSSVTQVHPIPSITINIRLGELSKENLESLVEIKIEIDKIVDDELSLRSIYGNLSDHDIEILKAKLRKLSDDLNTIISKARSRDSKQETLQVSIPTPRKLIVVATGNIRSKNNPSGNFVPSSTQERLAIISFDYLDLQQLRNFLNRYVETLCSNLGLERFRQSLNVFVKDLISTYEELIALRNTTDIVINLPSIRVLKNYILNYLGFLMLNQTMIDQLFTRSNPDLEIVHYVFSDLVVGSAERKSIKRIDYTEESLAKFKASLHEEYKNFLLSNLILTCRLPTGQLTLLSESKDGSSTISRIMRDHIQHIGGKMRIVEKIESEANQATVHDMFSVRFRIDLPNSDHGSSYEYFYSKQQLLTLFSVCSSLISGQRFILLTGEPQEGKSAMVVVAHKIFSEYLKSIMNENQESSLSIVKLVSIKPKELSIIDMGVRVKDEVSGKEQALQESELVKELRAANNSNGMLVLKIDEIDLTTEQTQQLNALLTKEKIVISDEVFDLSNVRIIATMNLSPVYLDNFLNRSITHVFMSDFQMPNVTIHYYDKQNPQVIKQARIDLRSYIFLFDELYSRLRDEEMASRITESVFVQLMINGLIDEKQNSRTLLLKHFKEILCSSAFYHLIKSLNVESSEEIKIVEDRIVDYIILEFVRRV